MNAGTTTKEAQAMNAGTTTLKNNIFTRRIYALSDKAELTIDEAICLLYENNKQFDLRDSNWMEPPQEMRKRAYELMHHNGITPSLAWQDQTAIGCRCADAHDLEESARIIYKTKAETTQANA